MSINLLIIISIGVVSYISFNNHKLFNQLLFRPYTIVREKEWYRFLTSAWVHGGFFHLFVNLFVLYGFGNVLEIYFTAWFGGIGKFYYLLLFLVSIVLSHLSTYFKHIDNYAYASVGASGGVSGVLFATIMLEPLQNLYLFALIPIPGIVFGVLYLIYSQQMANRSNDNINHEAHFYGALAGILVLVLLRPSVVPDFFQQLLRLVQ
jgi:membrane associated rhomboid family serine protease